MELIIISGIVLFSFFLLVYAFWQLVFMRNPAVHIPVGNTLVSPAFGTISQIIHFKEKETPLTKGLFGRIRVFTKDVAKEGSLVVITLTPFDVHYQRSPLEGIVKRVLYVRGRFANALLSDFAIENERNEILIQKGNERVKVMQVAGVLARRIHCFVDENKRVKKGELLGLITLGSQVVLITKRTKLFVKKGDRVRGGETIIS